MTIDEKVLRPRFPWAGGLTESERARSGAELISWLMQTANDRGLNLKQMAQELGVTYGYIAQLRNGIRQTRHISEEFSQHAARFLGVPRISVLLAAGTVRIQDFYENGNAVAADLDRALQIIAKDPAWGALLPLEAHEATLELKHFIVAAFERATGRSLMPGRTDLGDVLRSYESD